MDGWRDLSIHGGEESGSCPPSPLPAKPGLLHLGMVLLSPFWVLGASLQDWRHHLSFPESSSSSPCWHSSCPLMGGLCLHWAATQCLCLVLLLLTKTIPDLFCSSNHSPRLLPDLTVLPYPFPLLFRALLGDPCPDLGSSPFGACATSRTPCLRPN